MSYRSVQHAYDFALKKVGLQDRFSGTHFLRHFMAYQARVVCGSINAVQAVTGHRSVKIAEHYGSISVELQAKTVTQVENQLLQLMENASSAFHCAQELKNQGPMFE